MTDLVADDESQRLGISSPAADLEEIGVDDDVASKTVARRERVDLPVAEYDVGVGHVLESVAGRRFDDHPVSLDELRRRHLNAIGAGSGIRDASNEEQQQWQRECQQRELIEHTEHHQHHDGHVADQRQQDQHDERRDLPRMQSRLCRVLRRRQPPSVGVIVGCRRRRISKSWHIRNRR